LGLYDISGNAQEMVADRQASRLSGSFDSIFRGGSCLDEARLDARITNLTTIEEKKASGFRVAAPWDPK
jgi:hypothetical protein